MVPNSYSHFLIPRRKLSKKAIFEESFITQFSTRNKKKIVLKLEENEMKNSVPFLENRPFSKIEFDQFFDFFVHKNLLKKFQTIFSHSVLLALFNHGLMSRKKNFADLSGHL